MVGPTCVANQITVTSSADVATSKQTTFRLCSRWNFYLTFKIKLKHALILEKGFSTNLQESK